VKGALGTLELELDPAQSDASSREESRRYARQLARDFTYGDPEARRALREVYERLRGFSWGPIQRENLDIGSPRAAAVAEEILFAARNGRLVVRPLSVRNVFVRLEGEEEELLGPSNVERHALDYVFQYPDGSPTSGLDWVLTHPSGKTEKGTFGPHAAIHREDVDPGSYAVTLKEIERVEWSKASAVPNEEVELVARVVGFADGAPAKVRVFRKHDEADDRVLDTIEARVDQGRVECSYRFDDTIAARSSWEGGLELVAELSFDEGKCWAKTIAPLQLALKSLRRVAWASKEIQDGEDAELQIETVGYDDGTKLDAELWRFDDEGDHRKLASLPAVPIAGGRASFALPCAFADGPDSFASSAIGRPGEYFVRVAVDHAVARSRSSQLLLAHRGP
jgi:hypothetical protein